MKVEGVRIKEGMRILERRKRGGGRCVSENEMNDRRGDMIVEEDDDEELK